jgi:hypothetical protein
MKELHNNELKELKPKLEKEIENLQKFVDPAKKIVEELELKEELSEEDKKKLENSKSEVLLLEKEIKERKDKVKLVDEEVKRREEICSMIDNAIKDLDFEEKEVFKRYNPKSKKEEEVEEPLIKDFLVEFGWSHKEVEKEELRVDGVLQFDEEGNPREKVINIEIIAWEKHAVINNLKLHLDLEKANYLVRKVKDYKHNKKKGELEKRLKPLVENNVYFWEAFGTEVNVINGENHLVSEVDRIAKWDKDDLILFEEKVVKLEEAKVKVDEKEKKEKPLKDRKLEYKKIDDLLFEALIEKLEEGRPEKMEEYLKLRKEIKDKHPLEE